MLDGHLKAHTAPVADKENIVYFKDYRITVLSDRLFRIEKDKAGEYLDKATRVVWFRDMPKNRFTVTEGDKEITIDTGAVRFVVKDELCGTVKMVFQPSEENAKGAKLMLEENILDDVDAMYGAHIWGNFDAPLVDVSSGKRMSSFQTFKITVKGKAAHGSAPNLGVDAIAVSAVIINNLQQIVSRFSDPLTPLVITIGTIHGGRVLNAIADEVVMEGSARTFEEGTWLEDNMRQVIETTAATFGATAALEDYYYGTSPIVNCYEDINEIARGSVKKLYGEESLGNLPTMMASEDFSWYMQKVPSVFVFLGSRNREKGYIYTNHNEKYDVDETVLHRGAAVMAQFAADYLEKNK
ncbi:MAG: amidohydrolase [Lachnospiraceae bacterium]|nr:amidohydrolase [Lachnospiraceae bacterium]